jgi:hypothetical protein
MKPHLAATVFICFVCVATARSDDESITRQQIRFLEKQQQPLLLQT